MPNQNQNLEYYYAHHDNPTALVILNRGTEFEVDITKDVTQFNTTNAIDSITGSFTITLDNNNDHLIDRFNFSRIRKMSSIEIFVKPPKDFFNVEMNPFANSASAAIPEDVKTFDQLIDKFYGPNIDNRDEIKKAIMGDLNKTSVTTVPAYKMLIQGLLGANILPGYKEENSYINKNGTELKFDFGKVKQQDGSYREQIITIKLSKPTGMEGSPAKETDGFIIFPSPDMTVTTNINDKTGKNMPPTLATYAVPTFITLSNQIPESGVFTEENRQVAIKIPMPPGSFQRIFFGVITNTASNVQPGGNMTVTISGKGIGYWLEASVVNLFPGGFEQTLTSQDLSAFANRFAQSKALDIFRELISIGVGQFPATTNINLSDISTQQQYLALIGRENAKTKISDMYGNSLKATDEFGKEEEDKFVDFNADGIASGDVPGQLKVAEELKERVYLGYKPGFPNIARQSRWFDSANGSGLLPRPTLKTADNDSSWLEASKKVYDLSLENAAKRIQLQSLLDRSAQVSSSSSGFSKEQKDKILKALQRDQKDIQSVLSKNNESITKLKIDIQKMGNPGSYLRGLDLTISNLKQSLSALTSVSGRNQFLNNFGIIDHWKKIFSTITLEVMDNDPFLESIYPFSYAQKSPEASMDGDYISKAALAQQIAEYLQYEFYFDCNGHFILKPPFYNISVDDMGDLYKIDDTDVVSFSFNDTAEGIITRIGVAGDFREAPGVEKLIMYNIFQDMRLIREYGFHQKDVNNLYYITNPSDARDFGQAYLAKNNMKLFAGSITIHGRPSLRIGSPIYFQPRDTVFYIREISHEFSVGGGYQTTLNVIGGRRILTGYKRVTKVSNIVETVVDGEIKLEFKPGEKEISIQNYVLSNGLPSDAVLYDDITQGVEDSERQAKADEAYAKSISDNATGIPFILRNKYIITNHPNQQLIGLIVDSSNNMIAQINEANYNYFYDLKQENIPAGALQYVSPTPEGKVAIATSIRNFFIQYVQLNGIDAPDKFTITRRDNFIKAFLRVLKITVGNDVPPVNDGNLSNDQILSLVLKDANNVPSGGALNADQKKKLNILATVFNNLINYIDNNGLYKQLTDSSGRELFAYQNYGLGYMISNEVQQINNEITTTELEERRNRDRKDLDQNLANKAKQMSGIHNPNSSDFQKLMNQGFGLPLPSGTNTGKTT